MYKILLADDEGIELDALTFILEKNFPGQCTIETAKTGCDAVELAERFRQLHDARVVRRRFGGRHLFVRFCYQSVELVYPLFAFLYRGCRAAQLALALLAAFVVLAALAHGGKDQQDGGDAER